MVVVDDYFRYPVVHALQTLKASEATDSVRVIFAQFGIPTTLKTDNSPPFQSGDLSRSEELGFSHHRITPRWPKAIGK